MNIGNHSTILPLINSNPLSTASAGSSSLNPSAESHRSHIDPSDQRSLTGSMARSRECSPSNIISLVKVTAVAATIGQIVGSVYLLSKLGGQSESQQPHLSTNQLTPIPIPVSLPVSSPASAAPLEGNATQINLAKNLSVAEHRSAPLNSSEAVSSPVIKNETASSMRAALSEAQEKKNALFADLDLSEPKGLCGAYKCFFPSQQEGEGWLIANDRDPTERALRFELNPPLLSTTLNAAWDLANELQSKYGIQHFMLEPPAILDPEGLSRDEKQRLEAKVLKSPQGAPKTLGDYTGALLVQKLKKAPAGSVELKTTNSHFNSSEKEFGHSTYRLNQLLDRVPRDGLQQFSENFSRDLAVVHDILNEKPFFAEDFHIMIDLEGRIHHTDLDGRFNYFWWSPTEIGDANANIMVDHVKQYLSHWKGMVSEYVKAHQEGVS